MTHTEHITNTGYCQQSVIVLASTPSISGIPTLARHTLSLPTHGQNPPSSVCLNPLNILLVANLAKYKIMPKIREMIETLLNGYPSESME